LYPLGGITWRNECLETTHKGDRSASWALLMPVIIIAGIRFGLVTVTEAAGVAVVYSMLVGLFIYREMGLRDLCDVLYETGVTTGIIMILLSAAGIFSWLLAESQINIVVVDAIFSLSTHPVVVLLIINFLLLIIGIPLEPMPAMIIFMPALIPIGNQLGIDPIQFGWICVFNLLIGMLTPPVGMLLFVASAIGKIPMGPLVREIIPFLILCIIVLIAVTYVPWITTWVPNAIM
jgi:tripartite ATP-independent transporter DctM subunit